MVRGLRRGACAALLVAATALPAGAAREFIDDAGRKVALPDRVERVYAAGPPASVLVFALAPDTLIGWTRAFKEDEIPWIAPKYAELPELGRLTGRGNSANVEVVLKAKPELIVDLGSTSATFASLAERIQSQTGIPYVLLDGRLETTSQQIEKLGIVLGVPGRGRDLAGYAKGLIDKLQEKIATVPKDKRPLVLWDPAIIVTNDPNFHREVWKLPVWNSVTAVRTKRVYLSPHLPFGWFDYPPGANRLVGLLWLSEILYPQLFRHDLKRETAEFYRRFYHQAPSEEQLARLLGEPGVAPR